MAVSLPSVMSDSARWKDRFQLFRNENLSYTKHGVVCDEMAAISFHIKAFCGTLGGGEFIFL